VTRRGLLGTAALLAALLSSPAGAQFQLDMSNRSPLADAARTGDVAAVRALLANGASPNSVDLDSRYALILAASGDHPEIVALLAKARGVRLDVRDRAGNTAMHLAAERGYIQVAEALVAAKMNPDLDNRSGETPLIIAARLGQLDMVILLLRAGADASRQDYTGRTALDWAETNSRRAVADALRRAGPLRR